MADRDYEDEQPKHSFVNHYMSDPTYFNSWKRGSLVTTWPFPYDEGEADVVADGEPYYQTVETQHSADGFFTPTSSRRSRTATTTPTS
ncbi:hypothetical protein NHX12_017928 [Muraenolepis orangiensis]|uniref:Uncharacterized protein n=1 Tax=Muraenolepis orangiensis TaxID=630683 RepID=A0A9Q0EVS7_9TELE|nr:hypothetical protein NHX12_017928 [Muraenolepis orangiensis]